MKIGVDVSRTIGSLTGIGTYVMQIVGGLAAVDRDNQYDLYPFFWRCFSKEFARAFCPEQQNFRLRHRRLPTLYACWLWADPRRPRVARLFGRHDVFFSPAFTVPPFDLGPLVVTVHDLSCFTHPYFHEEANRSYSREETYRAAALARLLIAVSEHTARDLQTLLHVPAERIRVVPEGVDPAFRADLPTAEVQRVAAAYRLAESYVLFVGALEPRKNVAGLVRAYARLPESLRSRHRLVLAGAPGWKNQEVFAAIAALGLEDRVQVLGYVAKGDLPALYAGATVFAYPSFYEGFGLPVLEALACGAPVLSSRSSSLPEVVGQAGVLVEPEDEAALALALEQLLTDEALRQQLRVAGPAQASRFTWAEAGRRTLAVLEEAAS